jgi:predicted MFS family arabinose efflux permease
METHKAKIWSKDFFILFFVNIVSMMGFQMLNPNMAEYAAYLGAGTGMLGTVTAMFAFAALAARPFSGKAADQLDNKKLIIVSLAGITLSLFLYSFATSFTLMLAIRFIHGLFFGLNSTLVMTMASRTLPEHKMGSGMGIFSLGMVVSMTVAPTFGIYIAGELGYNWLFYIAGSIAAISVILVLFVNPQKPVKKDDGKKVPLWMTFFAPEAISPSLIGLLNSSAFGAVQTFLLLHAKERGVADIALYFTVNAISLMIFRPLISKYMDKIPTSYIIYPCSLFMVASMVLISVAHSLWVFLLAAVLFGIGNGGSQPALQTLCLKCVGFERRGASSGTYYIGLDIGNIIGPILAGVIAASFGYGGAFMFMIVPIFLGMGVMFLTDRRQKAQQVKQS